MTNKILIIPWRKDQELVQLIKHLLIQLGYLPVLHDRYLSEAQLNDIETSCLSHQPKVLITYFEYEDLVNQFKFCKMIRDSKLINDMGLYFLISRPPEHSIYLLPIKDPCLPDESIVVPFLIEEFEADLQRIISKTDIP